MGGGGGNNATKNSWYVHLLLCIHVLAYPRSKYTFCVIESKFKCVTILSTSGINWRHNTSQEATQEKLKLQVFIPVDPSRINESRYLTQHLLIGQVLGKLNNNFMFQPTMT